MLRCHRVVLDHQILVKGDRWRIHQLGQQPALGGALRQVVLPDGLEGGTGGGVVEDDEDVALLDHLTFENIDLPDDPA